MTLPIALDTNLLVRLLTNDDPLQAQRTAERIDGSSACFVPITVTLELEWVLRGAYRLPPAVVIEAIEALMTIHLEQEDQVRRALDLHRQGMDFAAALHLLRSEGCSALVTLDRALERTASRLNTLPPVQLLTQA